MILFHEAPVPDILSFIILYVQVLLTLTTVYVNVVSKLT